MSEIDSSGATTSQESLETEEDIPVFDFQFDLNEYFGLPPAPENQGESVSVNARDDKIAENKPDKQTKRFATLSTDELDEMVENGQAKRTKYVTNWAVSTFEGKSLNIVFNLR